MAEESNKLIDVLSDAILAKLGIETPKPEPEITEAQKVKATLEHLMGTGTFKADENGDVRFIPAKNDAAEAEGSTPPEAATTEGGTGAESTGSPPTPAADEETAKLLKVILGGQAPAKAQPKDMDAEGASDDEVLAAYEAMLGTTEVAV